MKKNQFTNYPNCLTVFKKLLLSTKIGLILTLFCFNQLQAGVFNQGSQYLPDFKNDKLLKISKEAEKINDTKHTRSNLRNKDIKEKIRVITPLEKQSQRKITGTITDESGVLLPGVNIIIKGTTTGTISDGNGNYSIDIPPGDIILVFSFIGYQTQEVLVETQTIINIILKEEILALEELIVVGYGTQKKANLTGAVTQVSSEKLENREVTRASLALVGELSGVSIRQLSGNPRETGGTIRIRGVGTFSSAGSNPLILVDGIPSSLDRLDPNDIQSVSVLKDAASAAIYGSQAANGVILVETKKGQAGTLKFNFYSYVGKTKPTMLPEMLNSWEYVEAHIEAHKNIGQISRYTEEDIQKYKSGTDPNYPNYDHMSAVWNSGKGLQYKHGISMSGGTEVSQYMFSASFLNNQGCLNNNDRQDYNIRLNLTSKLRENLKLNTNLFANQFKGRQPGQGGSTTGSGYARATRGAMRLNNTIIGIRDDGYYGHMETVHYADLWSPSFYKDNSLYLYGAVGMDWEVLKNLTITGKLAYTDNSLETKDFTADFAVSPMLRISPNSLTESWSKGNSLTALSLVNYVKTIGNHNFNLLGGFEQSENFSKSLSGFRNQFPTNDLPELNVGSVAAQTNNGSASKNKLRSYFGRINYNYFDKYLLEANVRYDGSSRFPKKTRWGMFPSFSGGWRISQEDFFKNALPWIYDLKFRGSWGELGNQSVGNYPYQDLITLTVTTPIGDAIVPGAAVTTIPNKNITWETTRVTDFGVDMVLLNGKLGLTADRYNRLTYDILYTLSRSDMMGASASPVNAGKVENKGWDFELSFKNNIRNLRYSISGNLGINHNKVLYLKDVEQDIGLGLFVGHPIGSKFGYKTDGLFIDEADCQNWPEQTAFEGKKPGFIRFKDLSGPDGKPDGKVDAAYDRTVIGQPIPITTYGLSLNADYKGLSLAMLFQGEGGRVASSGALFHFYAFSNDGNVQRWMWEERWTPENPNRNAKYPLMRFGGDYLANNTVLSDYWFWNATFLRLKNIQLAYNIPVKFTKKLGLNNLRLYINGENLFTIHNYYPNWDPEMKSDDISQGWYPLMRTWLFGINIDF